MDSTTLIMVLVLGVFVVYMIFASKNQKKKAQEHNKFRDNLKNGSIVMTQSGFVGKVVSSSENEIVLEYNGTQSVWLKRAIATEATLDKETEK
ncbi:MAG: preprotein translocase subunit YajC, partial [Bifidobacteriaceae bacterium]|nr:preprotein translocase subunit YajC [Bifidobacteriaceae bacterium]